MSYSIIRPETEAVPVLLSVPHTGTDFPTEIRDQFVKELAVSPDDTDWHLDRLYDFAPSLGITMIVPEYSRWVIDLNRDPSSKPLYNDGRLTTPLCPTTDFREQPIYVDRRDEVSASEVERRKRAYFDPYHLSIDQILGDFVERFGVGVFWDGHSIRRNVPSIQTEDFPDFILGDNDGISSSTELSGAALRGLRHGEYKVSYNHPFKGGYLTRSKGNPTRKIHALQLEMSKDLYMSEDETVFDESKASRVKTHLRQTLETIIDELGELIR